MIKIKVSDKNVSEVIQKTLFAIGYQWPIGQEIQKWTPFLFIEEGLIIAGYAEDEQDYENLPGTKVQI